MTKQSITLSEVYEFINKSYIQIRKNKKRIEKIRYRFTKPERIPYNDGGFTEYIEESDYPNTCENICDSCQEENDELYKQINILAELFEIDNNLETEYQQYIWNEAQNLQDSFKKKAEVEAQKLYDKVITKREKDRKELEKSRKEWKEKEAEILKKNPNIYSHCLECGMVGGYCNPCKFEDEYTKTTTITRKENLN